ncbi:hypothetical protein HZB94_01700 [Candidatus Falkowbacteria bacterium]|nr:hypothetical protein [Candidatus Falkowbacteria bacterium]
MFEFETSQDLFYLVLAFCIVWLTVFLCIALYYGIRLLKQADEMVRLWRERLQKAASIFEFIKSKLVTGGLKQLAAFAAKLMSGADKTKSKDKK